MEGAVHGPFVEEEVILARSGKPSRNSINAWHRWGGAPNEIECFRPSHSTEMPLLVSKMKSCWPCFRDRMSDFSNSCCASWKICEGSSNVVLATVVLFAISTELVASPKHFPPASNTQRVD